MSNGTKLTMDVGRVLGRGIAFPPRVEANGSIAWSQGEENVRESIRIILLTEQRERLMLPEFGGGLGRFLFEPNTASTRRAIQDRIERALRRWEPRITIEAVTVEQDPADREAAIATITYRLVATQVRERVSLSVALRS
jgi:phage baseplate assembly protein W